MRLGVSDAEREARLGRSDRHAFHKLTDVDTLRMLRSSGQHEAELPPVDLDIDTSTSSAGESARRIVEHFALRPERPPARFPEPD